MPGYEAATDRLTLVWWQCFWWYEAEISLNHSENSRVLGSFNGPGPGGPEVTISKVKERKRMILPGLHREPIKSLTQDLRFSGRHRVPSRGGGEGTGCLLERILEAWAEEWARRVSAFQRISRGEKETERKTDRQTNRQTDTGTQALMEQRCFISRNAGLYIFSKMITQLLHRMKFYQ